ncbi:uncharacterized protein LOC128883639 [Hylaeus volcanicus]|uniref:uncharacterized protein LOC128883639 n=1 Tax=Hylaeus volcanicus TaxID=313075 RepID=UPI0023B7A782|nr:uncharacterized protein LOC128883639 [Hylaeus volcanicus]
MRRLELYSTCLLIVCRPALAHEMNLTSLGLKLERPNETNAVPLNQEPIVQLSLRPEIPRRPNLKVPHTNGVNTAVNIAESAMQVLNHYIPTLMSNNGSLVQTITKVAGKFRSTKENSNYVNPLGLACNPKEVRLCSPKTLTTTRPPLFDYRDVESLKKRGASVQKASAKRRQILSSNYQVPNIQPNTLEGIPDKILSLLQRAQQALETTSPLPKQYYLL